MARKFRTTTRWIISFRKLYNKTLDDTAMQDKKFTVYDNGVVSLYGEIHSGCLHLESNIYPDDREKHYAFSKEDTDRLFSLATFDEFLEICRQGHLAGMEKYLDEHGIHPKTFAI